MAHMASDGKKFTNRPPMMAHERSLSRKSEAGGVTQHDPLQQPGEGEVDPNDKPMMTHHHEDGTHTTVHASGAEHHHASAEELVDHLKKHMPEEEDEMQHEEEPEYQ